MKTETSGGSCKRGSQSSASLKRCELLEYLSNY
jgi:hypothetical protein